MNLRISQEIPAAPGYSTDAPLFVSDLDHTLLRQDATLGEPERERLRRLLQTGLPFTVASARSIVSIRQILGDLPFRLPVIHYNGAFLTDYHQDRHYLIETVPPEVVRGVTALGEQVGARPMISAHEGDSTNIYHRPAHNAGVQWYLDERRLAGDRRLLERPNLEAVAESPVVVMTLIDSAEVLGGLQAEIEQRWGDRVWTHLYLNQYNPPWHWLSIHPLAATKARALQRMTRLLEWKPKRLTVFGDHDNDRAMFELADHAVAVGNATELLKRAADEVIGTNREGAVIDYLETVWDAEAVG